MYGQCSATLATKILPPMANRHIDSQEANKTSSMPLTDQQMKVARRQEMLERIFDGLRDHLDLGPNFEHLEINRTVLFNVVVSYFHDVDRHKQFHGTKLVDETKQGAFTMKWIAKLRPIQFDHPEPIVSPDILFINEIFSVRCGLAFLNISPDILPASLYYDMLYTLRYRCVDERLLFLWLATIVAAVNGDISRPDDR